jgi:hypothetical protein
MAILEGQKSIHEKGKKQGFLTLILLNEQRILFLL